MAHGAQALARTIIGIIGLERCSKQRALSSCHFGYAWLVLRMESFGSHMLFLKTFDPYIATGNGIGAILGFIQLCVYIYFSCCRKTTLEGVKPSEVQLQKTKADWTLSAPPV
ncbi:Uncharacterized protein Fot_27279 [Forsythia ovata]|uniref:Bidirectional sugar transporter SWEET n=1 Tax=Forsythia ovata TaxID=205694 RepID=A0ABD1UEE1_9LAMI